MNEHLNEVTGKEGSGAGYSDDINEMLRKKGNPSIPGSCIKSSVMEIIQI